MSEHHSTSDQQSASSSEAREDDKVEVNIKITESAVAYLKSLVDRQESSGMGVRIFVEKPGTPHAECCMAYCPAGESEATDYVLAQEGFNIYLKGDSLLYLVDAEVDYNKDRFGGQLTFRAPKSKVPQLGENASLEEQIFHVLQAEINPMLASHGGNVALECLDDNNTTAVLKFGGGCQGCASVDLTLKEGIEKTLLDRFPSLVKVIDVTDHTNTDNAYY